MERALRTKCQKGAVMVGSVLAWLAPIGLSNAADVSSDLIGAYDCVYEDTSEIYDNEDDNGHHYFDSDGDERDPKLRHQVLVDSDTIKFPWIFAGKAGALSTYKIVFSTAEQLIAVENVGRDDVLHKVLIFSRDPQGRSKFGYAETHAWYSSPLLRNGEAQSVVSLKLGHCIKAQSE